MFRVLQALSIQIQPRHHCNLQNSEKDKYITYNKYTVTIKTKPKPSFRKLVIYNFKLNSWPMRNSSYFQNSLKKFETLGFILNYNEAFTYFG